MNFTCEVGHIINTDEMSLFTKDWMSLKTGVKQRG